jgi:hypothetical protein
VALEKEHRAVVHGENAVAAVAAVEEERKLEVVGRLGLEVRERKLQVVVEKGDVELEEVEVGRVFSAANLEDFEGLGSIEFLRSKQVVLDLRDDELDGRAFFVELKVRYDFVASWVFEPDVCKL